MERNYPRRIGQSTRLADHYIQELFAKGKITVKDHHDSEEAVRHLFTIIMNRLDSEHRHIEFKTVDKQNFIIELEPTS